MVDPKNGIYVFDHHPHKKYPGQTACSRVDKFLGLTDPLNKEVTKWSIRADFKSGGDSMNVGNIMKNLHLLYPDTEVLKWLLQMLKVVYYQGKVELSNEKGRKFFKEYLREFLDKNPLNPGFEILKKWEERVEKGVIEDGMNNEYSKQSECYFKRK
jgi:hypothetical protein